MEKPNIRLYVFSLGWLIIGISLTVEGVTEYAGILGILFIAGAGLMILALIPYWINNKISRIVCITALLSSFVILEFSIVLKNPKLTYMIMGFWPLIFLLGVLELDLKRIFKKNRL